MDVWFQWLHVLTSGSPAADRQHSGQQGCAWHGSASHERCTPPSRFHGCGPAGNCVVSLLAAAEWLLNTEDQSRYSFKAPETVQSACSKNCDSTFTGLLLTFVVSMCCTVVAEESVQHGFLWTSRLDSLLLHQPEETTGFVRPGQRSHLLWEPRASNPTSTTGSVILTKPRWNNKKTKDKLVKGMDLNYISKLLCNNAQPFLVVSGNSWSPPKSLTSTITNEQCIKVFLASAFLSMFT